LFSSTVSRFFSGWPAVIPAARRRRANSAIFIFQTHSSPENEKAETSFEIPAKLKAANIFSLRNCCSLSVFYII